MLSVKIILFAPLLLVHSLDLEAALAQGKFEQIFGDKTIDLDPSSNPSRSMFFDNPNIYQTTEDPIFLRFHGKYLSDEDYKLGLSLLILSFNTDNQTTSMEVIIESNQGSRIQRIFKNDIDLPSSTIQEENIIRTWDEEFDDDDLHPGGWMEIDVALNDLTARSKVCHIPHLSASHLTFTSDLLRCNFLQSLEKRKQPKAMPAI